MLPLENTVAGVIETLRAANEELLYVDPPSPSRPVKILNEIAYADDAGTMQFLRRTLLAGAYKFDRRSSQVLPRRLLDYFRSHLNYVRSLICIGYGFGDPHINDAVKEWLEFRADRTLRIVDPYLPSIPSRLLHLAPQVTLVPSTATEFLDGAGGITRSRLDHLERRLYLWTRAHPGKDGRAKFLTFAERFRGSQINALVDKIKTLPVRDGDIDLVTLGLTRDELIDRWSGDVARGVEDLLETFLVAEGG